MDARIRFWLLLGLILPALGASARTKNFVVTASSPALAREVAQTAEMMRQRLAVEWLGRELPDWGQPCPVVVVAGQSLGAGGRTSFMFRDRTPFGWDMEIQGSRERILDSVLPHEITHTIFATHFGRPLPRWADEGACTTVEHSVERRKHEDWLLRFLKSEKGIPFNHMFAMTEYPSEILPLYSQGYSVTRYLIAQGGKPKFVQFVGHGMQTGDWASSVHEYYGFESLGDLQLKWVDWVAQGSPISPSHATASDVLLASATNAVAAESQHPEGQNQRGERPRIDDQLVLASSNLSPSRDSDRPGKPRARSWYARRQTVTQQSETTAAPVDSRIVPGRSVRRIRR